MKAILVTQEHFWKRVQELALLEDDWLNGDGKSIPGEFLEWFSTNYREYLETVPRYPYLFPTLEGGLSLEYETKNNLSVEIDPLTRKAEFFVTNRTYGIDPEFNDEFTIIELDLNNNDDWVKLNTLLTKELSRGQ